MLHSKQHSSIEGYKHSWPHISNKDDEVSQVIVAIGNNDLPEDYVVEEWDRWAANLYQIWSPEFIPPTEENREVGSFFLMVEDYLDENDTHRLDNRLLDFYAT